VSPRSPEDARPRPDLTFLRRRTRPAAVAPAAGSSLADFLRGDDPHRPHSTPSPTPAAPVVSSSLDLSSLDLSAPTPAPPTPVASSSLDLSTPTPAPPTPVASSSLDLSTPTPAPPTPVASSSLDLSTPAPTPPTSPTSQPWPAPPPAAATPVYRPPRVKAGSTLVLTTKAPTVTLTRVQSGVGALTIEAASSRAVGDLRLGCAYQLRSGPTGVVQQASGVSSAPPASRQPLIVGQRAQFERLTIDLLQVRDLERLVVYAFSESDVTLQWGGTLVVSTFGKARIDVPVDREPSGGVLVLLTVFNIAGELVLRAGTEAPIATVRDACVAFGFERIAWLDARTPLT
jgi:hypothetical protein